MPKYSNSLNWRVNVKVLLFFVWFTSILCWCKKSLSSSVFWNYHTAMNQDLSLDKQTYCPLIVLQVACLHRPYVDNRFFRPNLLTLIFIMIGRKIRNITIIFLCCICCKEVYCQHFKLAHVSIFFFRLVDCTIWKNQFSLFTTKSYLKRRRYDQK